MYQVETIKYQGAAQAFLRLVESKAALKRAASRTLGTVQRALEEANTAIAESINGHAGSASMQVCATREV